MPDGSAAQPALSSLHLSKEESKSSTDQLSEDLALFLSNPSLRTALADGSLDLASYSSTVAQELHELETECIGRYQAKSTEIEQMRDDLQECQTVLASLHEMLLGFQADLGGLSGEIRSLQEKSRTLDVQLRNRRAAEKGLKEFLTHIVISPNLAHALTTGPVNPTFLQAVQELEQIHRDCRLTDVQDWAGGKAPGDTVAATEMQDKVETLRLLAVRRVREYFLEQISLLRRPQTNVRMIQVHGLLKYAALQDFLQQASPEIAGEILNVYLESMSKTLLQLFRTYQAQLLQLDSTKLAATRQDVVIAVEDSLLRDSLTTRAKKRVDLVCLGRRAADVLDEADPRPILAHVALAEKQRYPYERLFRSLLGHLVDAVTNEYVFSRQFFKRDCFTPLFHGTLSLVLEQLENYLFGCYDAICLLLMIQVSHYYRRLTRNRKIQSLDHFFDQVTHLLWPRLKVVMDLHLRSLKQASAPKLGGVDLQQHYVSRRFAEFCCSILLILQNKSGGAVTSTGSQGSNRPEGSDPATPGRLSSQRKMLSDTPAEASAASTPGRSSAAAPGEEVGKSAGDMLLIDLAQMSEEYINLLNRLAEQHSTHKKKIIFLINNLDHVVTIFQERRVVGKEYTRFGEMLMNQRELFVEEELLTGFSKMIAFTQQTEGHFAMKRGGTADVNTQVVEKLVLDFAATWKANIDMINRDVLSYFSNFRNGMEILKQVLTQLLLYYTRFQDIIRKVWRNKPPAFAKHIISTTVILAEIKKHALTI